MLINAESKAFESVSGLYEIDTNKPTSHTDEAHISAIYSLSQPKSSETETHAVSNETNDCLIAEEMMLNKTTETLPCWRRRGKKD